MNKPMLARVCRRARSPHCGPPAGVILNASFRRKRGGSSRARETSERARASGLFLGTLPICVSTHEEKLGNGSPDSKCLAYGVREAPLEAQAVTGGGFLTSNAKGHWQLLPVCGKSIGSRERGKGGRTQCQSKVSRGLGYANSPGNGWSSCQSICRFVQQS